MLADAACQAASDPSTVATSSASASGAKASSVTQGTSVSAANARALAVWWSKAACASGTTSAGNPTIASSASVTAPADVITKSAHAYAAAMSSTYGTTSAETSAAA